MNKTEMTAVSLHARQPKALILSVVDFTPVSGRQPDPAGDRVKIHRTGKFLKYKAW